MAMSTAPVATSPQVAYSLLPSVIHDSKKRGGSLIPPFALLHFQAASRIGGTGLTQQRRTSG